MSPSIFAERLRMTLALRDLTQTELGRRIGRQQRTVSDWCAANTLPNADDILACARELNVATDWLLGRVDHPSGLNPGSWVLDEDLLATARSDRRAAVKPGYRVGRRPLVLEDGAAQALFEDIRKERKKR